MVVETTPLPKTVVLVALHFGINSGGEAIKAYQFAEFLKDRGVEVIVVTHRRALKAQGAGALDVRFLVVEDSALQRFLWKTRPLRGMLDLHFHVHARQLIDRHIAPAEDIVLHYIAPVSPVATRSTVST